MINLPPPPDSMTDKNNKQNKHKLLIDKSKSACAILITKLNLNTYFLANLAKHL